MDVIVETDIGHDPDDFFALCYLVSCGVNIKAITVVPGDPDQIAIARLFCSHVGLNIPIGASKLNRIKPSSGGVHHQLLHKFGKSLSSEPDGLGKDIIVKTISPETELFIIGPVTNVANYLKSNSTNIKRATMQGGFLGYHLHNYDCVKLPNFEGKSGIATFNMNGDRPGALEFINSSIEEKRFVGKHICHTVFYDKQVHQRCKPKDAASELFKLAMDMYLEKHDGKKFHDPTAAVCHLHPEIANWVKGKIIKIADGWGTELREDGDFIIANINYDLLWNHILNFN